MLRKAISYPTGCRSSQRLIDDAVATWEEANLDLLQITRHERFRSFAGLGWRLADPRRLRRE
jgi:hypothetical protein